MSESIAVWIFQGWRDQRVEVDEAVRRTKVGLHALEIELAPEFWLALPESVRMVEPEVAATG